MNQIGIYNQTKQDIPELTELSQFIDFVVHKQQLEEVHFNVILVDNEHIQELNRVYRNIDKPTDVISFALEDTMDVILPIRMLGDIYISIDQVLKQALEYGHSQRRELFFLTVHGILHLLGYDHMNVEDEKVMFSLQERILKEYGVER